MSDTDPNSESTSSKKETTFRSFNHEQGSNYAQNRRDYHPKLYQTIIDYHKSNDGHLDLLVDVGCGPGTAARSFAPRFTHAIGIDPSEGMISAARSLGGVTSTLERIRFEMSSAEDLGIDLKEPIANNSVDIITAATAAHWFDMPRFWVRTAQVLKPGGTVALWTSSSMRTHPDTPNAVAIQAAIDNIEEALKDYTEPGNLLARNLLIDLPLPWTLPSPVLEFDEKAFVRKEWGTDAGSERGDQFFTDQRPANLDMLEKILGTTSPVVRWREAHPEAVGTERDVVKKMRIEIEKLLDDAGVEKEKQLLKGAVKGALLLVRKKA